MLVNDKLAAARLTSPLNLINQLHAATSNNSNRKKAMSLFIPSVQVQPANVQINIPDTTQAIQTINNPFETKTETFEQPRKLEYVREKDDTINEVVEPSLSDIIINPESQIKLGLAHDNAIDLLTRAVDTLALKLDDVRADKLPSVISAASRTVESIRKEQLEARRNKKEKDSEVHFHFYTPQQKKVSEYEVIEIQ
jgi:hypothetical protein